MNDWNIKKFLVFVGIIQMVMLGLVGLDNLGFDVPGLRQIIGFIYLTFVPGVLILRILKIHGLGFVNNFLYAIGLSVAFQLFYGLTVNTVGPFIGIARPISDWSLTISSCIAVFSMCIVAFIRDRNYSSGHDVQIDVKKILSPRVLVLFLLPLLSILGTCLVNYYDNHTLLIVMMPVIAIIVILAATGKIFPQSLFPLIISMISISLLFHTSLISMYTVGWDIQVEYYVYDLVQTNGYWDSMAAPAAAGYNGMLSCTLLPGIYSNLLNIEGLWIFKVIIPLLFSLVPVALYQAYREQTSNIIAFLGAFFFSSFAWFFHGMLEIVKMQMAEVFLAFIVLLIVEKKMSVTSQRLLFVVFTASMVVSHYAVSYVFMLYIIFALVVMIFLPKILSLLPGRKYITDNSAAGKESFNEGVKLKQGIDFFSFGRSLLNINSIILFCVIALLWYMYTAGSHNFYHTVIIGDHIYNSIINEFFNPAARGQGVLMELGIASGDVSSLAYQISNILSHFTRLLIVIGVIKLLVKYRDMNFSMESIALTISGLITLLMAVVLPRLTTYGYSSVRLYQQSLFFLAPFCVLGLEVLLRKTAGLVRFIPKLNQSFYIKLTMILLIPYFLFNTGFIFQVFDDTPSSFTLDSTIDFPRFNQQEVESANWLLTNMDESSQVYVDYYSFLLFLRYRPRGFTDFFEIDQDGIFITVVSDNAYIYLRSLNTFKREILIDPEPGFPDKYYLDIEETGILNLRSKIYDNGSSEVYK